MKLNNNKNQTKAWLYMAVLQLYLGIILKLLPVFLYNSRILDIYTELGDVFVTLGAVLLGVALIVKRMDYFNRLSESLYLSGISEIIPVQDVKENRLENIILQGNDIKMVISLTITWSRALFLYDSIKESYNGKYQLLIARNDSIESKETNPFDAIVESDPNVRYTNGVKFEDFYIIDDKVFLVQRNHSNNKVLFISVIQDNSPITKEYKKQFEKLWDESLSH